MTWPPTPTAILSYIAIVATVAAVVSGVAAYRQGQDNTNRIDDITVVQGKLCKAVGEIGNGETRNIEARLQQNKQFTKSPAVAASFGLTVEQLKALSAQSAATDQKLAKDIQHAVELACR
jgi:hypothetical protein